MRAAQRRVAHDTDLSGMTIVRRSSRIKGSTK
jgi:hypothetical protein